MEGFAFRWFFVRFELFRDHIGLKIIAFEPGLRRTSTSSPSWIPIFLVDRSWDFGFYPRYLLIKREVRGQKLGSPRRPEGPKLRDLRRGHRRPQEPWRLSDVINLQTSKLHWTVHIDTVKSMGKQKLINLTSHDIRNFLFNQRRSGTSQNFL